LKITTPLALALPKVYVEIIRSNLYLFCVYVCVCVCVCTRARKIDGFFWKYKIELHSGLRIKYSLLRKHRLLRKVYFWNFLILISVSLTLSFPKLFFYSSCLVIGAFS